MLKWFEKLTDKELQNLLAKNKHDYYIDEYGNVYKKLYKHDKYTFFEKCSLSTKEKQYDIIQLTSDSFIKSEKNNPELFLLTYDKYKKYLLYCFENINTLDIAFSIAKKHYGNDNVELIESASRLLIYIPVIKITSENTLEHEMKDVYLEIEVYDKMFSLLTLYRGTLSSSECRNDYLFSHCNGNTQHAYSRKFCFGNYDTPMNRIFHKSTVKKDFILNMDYLFYILDNYLSWESISGTPYKEISHVKNDLSFYRPINQSNNNYNYKEIEKYSNTIINKLTSISYEYTSTKNLILKQDTINEIKKLSEEFNDVPKLIIDGEQCEINSILTYDVYNRAWGGKHILTFKGENVYLKIEDTDPTPVFTTGLDPQTINNVINYIEEKLKFILWKQHQEQLILTQLEN
jgi:hypothetical protein